jgi:hypothetical protein
VRKILLILSLLCALSSLGAQSLLNPSQIAWPLSSGAGSPSGAPCPTAVTGTTTLGSATVTGLSAVIGLLPYQAITGAGIPSGTTVVSVQAYGASVTLSAPATATAAGVSLSFYAIGLPYLDTDNSSTWVCGLTGWAQNGVSAGVASLNSLSGAVVLAQGANISITPSGNTLTIAAQGGAPYPAAGVPLSTGSAWGASYTVGTGDNDLVQLNGSAQLPAVSMALLTGMTSSQVDAALGYTPVAPTVTSLPDLTSAAGGAFGTGAYATIADYAPLAGTNTFTGTNVFSSTLSASSTFSMPSSGAVLNVQISPAPYIELQTSYLIGGTNTGACANNSGVPSYWSIDPSGDICGVTLALGSSGVLGSETFGNATSGTITLKPVIGALGTVTASLPANTGTVAELNLAQTWSATQTFGNLTVTGTPTFSGIEGASTYCLQISSVGVLSNTGSPCGSGSGAVNSVSNSNGTLTISPTTGSVVASLNLANANTWTAIQTFPSGSITNAELANDTISGIALGGNLDTLTFGAHLVAGGLSYNGSVGVTISSDATNANTASTIVARDGSGNFSAGTIMASLTGTASLATNLVGTGVDSAPYQSASATTSYIAAPTTSGHTFAYAWQPTGSAVAPMALDLGTWYATQTYGGTLTSSQVTAALGYTPADCTAGTAAGDCITNGMTTLGDLIYGGASGIATRLAGPTAGAATYVLSDVTSGSLAVAPTWVNANTLAVSSATMATNATDVATTTRSGNTAYYLALVGANSTSNQGVSVGPATYNPSTGNLAATEFNGVALTTGDAATTYLNGAGNYTTPSGSGTVGSGGGYAVPIYGSAASTAVGPSNITSDSTGNNLYVPGTLSTGSSTSGVSGGTGGVTGWGEGTDPTTVTGSATLDICAGDSTLHSLVCYPGSTSSALGTKYNLPMLPTTFGADHVVAMGATANGYALLDAGYAYNSVPLSDMATQTANTVLANVTAGTASPTAASLSTGIQYYTAGSGFSEATAAELGALLDLPQYSIPYSAGATSALTDVASPTANGVYAVGWDVTGAAAVAPASFQLTGAGISCTGSPLVCAISGSGTVSAAAQYGVAYYTQSGTTAQVGGLAAPATNADWFTGYHITGSAASAPVNEELVASTINSVGLTVTPTYNATGPTQRFEITGSYSGMISSSQVTTGLGYTPANCTAGTANGDCVTNGMTTLGDLLYGGASGASSRLAGPTGAASTTYVLEDITTGGSAAQAPGWTNAPALSAANMTSFPSSLATSGANSNITSLTGLTTPLTTAQGGTGGAGVLTGIRQANGSSADTVATAHQMAASVLCTDTSSSATTYTCVPSPAISSLTAGDSFTFCGINQNNSGDSTLAIGSASAVHIRKWQNTATLASGDLQAGACVGLKYDGTYLEAATIGNPPSGGTPALSAVTSPTASVTFTQPSGDTTIFNGTAPASSSSTGTAATTAFSVTDAVGGATTGSATTAGAGAGTTFTAGAGGSGAGGTNAVGGAGGSITIKGGAGGASSGTGANANGGNVVLTPGAAGSGGSGGAGSLGSVIVSPLGAGVVHSSSGGALSSAVLPHSCEVVWGGTGTSNVLQSGDDAIADNSCFNKTGVTETIIGLYCMADIASNTVTITPTYGSTGTGTTICSGALTCGSSYAYSSTCTVSNGSLAVGNGITPVMGGPLNAHSIHMLVVYTTP